MGDLSITVLAAEEGGQNNFLLPNGTFIFVLLIFLIVLGVIAKFVVPPISAVLHEREAMVAKTEQDNRKSAELLAAAHRPEVSSLGPVDDASVRAAGGLSPSYANRIL